MRLALATAVFCLAGCTFHTYEPAPQPTSTTVVVPSTPGSVGTVVTMPPGAAAPTSTYVRSP